MSQPGMADPVITVKSQSEIRPEASSLTALLAHPLLQDPKFVAAAGGLALLLFFLTCEWNAVPERYVSLIFWSSVPSGQENSQAEWSCNSPSRRPVRWRQD